MLSLQVLKLEGNPILFPPKEILQPQTISSATGLSHENDFDEPAVTLHIKRFLKQKQISDRSEQDSGAAEASEGGAEIMRPIKRVVSGRFPIKVNGNEVPDLRSPCLIRPPPIPSRSHYRGLSQQNSAIRRSGVLPLTIGNTNERLRSNSDIIWQPQREKRVFSQLRRMGIVPKKSFDLDPVNEASSNRYSHYRGLSHGSAIIGNQSSGTSNYKSPTSPSDPLIQRATYVRRLSSLPERKRELASPDPDVEAAKSILYALFQVHPVIQSLLGVARDATSKRTSLERVFYNATTHVEELDKTIQEFMMPTEEEEETEEGEEDEGTTPQSSENVHHACVTCVNAYIHVLNLLQSNVDSLIENGDPRYVRSLLLLLYGSTCEIYAAHMAFLRNGKTETRPEPVNTAKSIEGAGGISQVREKIETVARHIPPLGPKVRSTTAIQSPSNAQKPLHSHPLHLTNVGRAVTFSGGAPRDTFGLTGKSGSQSRKADFTEEERLLEKILLRLQQSLEMTTRAMPLVYNHFLAAAKISNQQSNPNHSKKIWQILIQKWLLVAQSTETLKRRMPLTKSKELGIRTHGCFWELCYSFIQVRIRINKIFTKFPANASQAFTELAVKVKEAKNMTTLLSNDIIVLLRPLQKAIKETSHLIQSSPWYFLASPPSNSANGSFSTRSNYQTSLPMTPMSGRVIPTEYTPHTNAISTSHGLPIGTMFNGSVFDRAEALLSMNNSASSSRNTTMSSVSLASVVSNDGTLTPSSITSPMNSFASKYNGAAKVILS